MQGISLGKALSTRTGRPILWATARVVFYVYIGFALFSVIGGWLTAPVLTWCFFGDWRFWRFRDAHYRLFLHGWKMLALILKGENSRFMFSVPLGATPSTAPLKEVAYFNPGWIHGTSCGDCTNCCSFISCPVLDKNSGLCRGYNSFFWRYFNCGRFPSVQPEIDYYLCKKWLLKSGTR